MEEVGEPDARRWVLRQRPSVEGAVVALDPHTGRVLAMSGGFSYRQSKFNRATQAQRQPGSAFKPFVYLAALESGMTPVSMVLDAPISLDQGAGPADAGSRRTSATTFSGPITLRVGLERSRNLISVRVAQKVGMDQIIELARPAGHRQPGAAQPRRLAGLQRGDADRARRRLCRCWSMAASKIEPVLVERIQDRHGRTIMRARPARLRRLHRRRLGRLPAAGRSPTRGRSSSTRATPTRWSRCSKAWCERGTAKDAQELGKPLAGKTGTTNDSKDTWFVGFSPDLVVAVWVGFDQPQVAGPTRNRRHRGAADLDRRDAGGAGGPAGDAVPHAARAQPRARRRDDRAGSPAGGDNVIAEAFLPGTEPGRDRSTVEESTREGPVRRAAGLQPRGRRRPSGGLY